MARALKSRRRVATRLVRPEDAATAHAVSGVELSSRQLVVIDAGDATWLGFELDLPNVVGAIVWLRAPAEAPEGAEDRIRDAALKAGAYRVRKLARERAFDEVEDRGDEPAEMPADEDDARRAMRVAAEDLARESAEGEQLERLLGALDQVLSEAGL